jgi:hypothetical protein
MGDLTRAVTHLVTRSPQGKKYEAAKRWGICIVSLEWLQQSISRGMILDEKYFDPLLPAEQRGKGAFVPREKSLGKRQRAVKAAGEDVRQRKLRKTASMKLGSQRDTLWSDILGSKETPAAPGSGLSGGPAVVGSRPEGVVSVPAKEEGIFATSRFYIDGFEARKRGILAQTITSLDGTLCGSLERLSVRDPSWEGWHRFVIVPQDSQADAISGLTSDSTDPHRTQIVTEFFIEKCIHSKTLLNPESHALGRPFPSFPISGFERLAVCSAGFTGLDLHHLERAITQLGATFEETFRKNRTSLLMCKSLSAVRKEKLKLALDWGVPVISPEWLWACISSGTNLPVSEYIFPELKQKLSPVRADAAKSTGHMASADKKKSLSRSKSEPTKRPKGVSVTHDFRVDTSAFAPDSPPAKPSHEDHKTDSGDSAHFQTALTHLDVPTSNDNTLQPLSELAANTVPHPPSFPPKSPPIPAPASERPASPSPSSPSPTKPGGAKKSRLSERREISNKFISLIESATVSINSNSLPDEGDAKRRQRHIFGRAVSNASAASNMSAENGRLVGFEKNQIDKGEGEQDGSGDEPPPTQVEYQDPEALEYKAAILSKMGGGREVAGKIEAKAGRTRSSRRS